MKSVHVYLSVKHSQTAADMRLEHIAKTLDKDLIEIRIYTCGEDFFKSDVDRPLPFGMIDGKAKSDENFFKEIVGDKDED